MMCGVWLWAKDGFSSRVAQSWLWQLHTRKSVCRHLHLVRLVCNERSVNAAVCCHWLTASKNDKIVHFRWLWMHTKIHYDHYFHFSFSLSDEDSPFANHRNTACAFPSWFSRALTSHTDVILGVSKHADQSMYGFFVCANCIANNKIHKFPSFPARSERKTETELKS